MKIGSPQFLLDLVAFIHSSKFGKLSSGHRTGKGQFLFQSQRKAMPKNAQTTAQIALISHASKVMLNSPRQASAICEP